ncbi:CDP-alcohol phosphatidyltransferase family protein [Akkermansiaceae bacterium]|nr:CDP-alcohol phosphatidyltransferase family protein [Akkermansiaceae bacterium]
MNGKNTDDPKVTCYSGGEAGFMAWSQGLRAALLDPLLHALTWAHVTANHITVASLLCGLAFVPAFGLVAPWLAFSLLFLHVLLDGLDGPLARFRGTASDRGSFTDTMVDQLVVSVVMIAMIHSGHAGLWPGSLYIFFYLLVVTFAFIRNALKQPYSWLLRPRFIVFIWLMVDVYLWPGTLDWVLWAAVAVLALKSATGFWVIRRRM